MCDQTAARTSSPQFNLKQPARSDQSHFLLDGF